ncbi:2-phosphosulfolactate phosphatase [Calditrichota bacterium GD2]
MPVVDVLFAATDLVQANGAVAVIIDVLRASSTIVTALQNGCQAVIPAGSISEAQKEAARRENVLLAGERNAIKPEHFHLGNSPLEFTPEAVQGKWVVLTTTNGTRALKSVENACTVIIGSFLNARAVARFLEREERDVLLYCAGSDGRFALEDTLCAAEILRQLKTFSLADGARWTLHGAKSYLDFSAPDKELQILNAVSRSRHALRLINLGFEEDVAFCARLNQIDIVPLLKDGKLIK